MIVLVGIAGLALTIYRVSMARGMAREAGLDPDRAAAVRLLTKEGLDATYVASTLRDRQAPAPSPAPQPEESASERLRELQQLRDDGLVTADEYDARRRAIIESV